MAYGVFDCEALLKGRRFEHEYLANEVLVHASSATGNVLIGEVVERRGVQSAVIDDYVLCRRVDAFDHR
ncbi:hypothetical protein D3C85_1669640 [compost metagenome]